MTPVDLFLCLQWWFVIFFLGLIFLPSTSLLFNSFLDKGYIFSKILSLLVVGYIVWFIASLKILPFNTFLITSVSILFLLINIFILIKKNLLSDLKKNLKYFILEEFILFIAFLFWSFIKAHEPSIHGLEKFMDFGFINSILRSEFFPPKDIWLSPETINYYYFGHFISALIIKLSSITPSVGYNLTLSFLFGLVFTASFSIGANLYYFFNKSAKILIIFAGFLSAFLVTLGGNLHTVYIFFQNYPLENPVPFWQLPMMMNFDGYWYPNATRFILFTIHEFPSYSFVVSDLHGHVLDIPFVLLAIALLIKIFHSSKVLLSDFCFLGLLSAVFLMTNFLDAPIYLLIIFIFFIVKEKSLTIVSKNLSIILILVIFFSLPFWFSFKPFGSGIGVLCAPQFLVNMKHLGPFLFETDKCARSPIWMLIILWGFPLVVFLSFLFGHIRNTKYQIPNKTDLLAITLSIAAFILILIPEFFYVKDIYPAHYRANTVFKFGYQAFIILGLISGYLIIRILTQSKKTFLYVAIIAFFFTLVAIYPYFAINSYFSNLKNYQGLDGLGWLENSYPTDFQAIKWINQNISGQPVILEAQGDSYTDFARISANTGLPTVIGWTVHEWLWRGSYDESGKRVTEVTNLYESSDIDLTKELIQKYNIEYVFIGTLERQKYTRLDEQKFQQIGKIIFNNGQTKIYKID